MRFGLVSATLVVLLGTGAAVAEGLAGPYLAGRAAGLASDYGAAADYTAQALTQDPTNARLLDSGILSFIDLGQPDKALVLARQAETIDQPMPAAQLLLLADQAKSGDFEGMLTRLGKPTGLGPLESRILTAWAIYGAGRMSEAQAELDRAATEPGMAAFTLYHKALMFAAAGDFESAEALLADPTAVSMAQSRRGVMAHVQILSQLERGADALALIDKVYGPRADPSVAALRARIAAGERIDFDVITSAADGVAETLYTIAAALADQLPGPVTISYARQALYVRPGHIEAILLASSVLETKGQFGLATDLLATIPADDPSALSAEMGRADALVAAGDVAGAIAALEALGAAHPDRVEVWATLGDVLRREGRHAEAVAAYDKGIALFATPDRSQWVAYYARGMSQEREKNWPAAEADFRKALELSPDQPAVMNYYGYSLLERKERLDEAMDMIQRAVAARPDDGAIVDSLAWGYFRLGRYAEAVEPMERAIELEATDPVVNDHLGDVYWAVGRKLEARFQWKRALSFKPDTEEEAARIRRKLEVGLDAVLAEEGAPPLKAAP